MKRIIGIVAMCAISQLYAQELETVLSIVQVRQENSWYEVQLDLWKKEVEMDITSTVTA